MAASLCDSKRKGVDMKKYFWLKLKTDFFTSIAMKKLRRIAGGDTYTIIYLKLQLLSLKDEGTLYYEGIEPTFYEEMAIALDEDAENVQATLLFLESVGLLSQKSESEYLLTEVPYLIGGECDSAERVRKHRKALQCNTDVTESNNRVTKCNTEIEIDIDKDIEKELETDIEKSKSENKSAKADKPVKHTYGEYKHVKLTDNEVEKLNNDYGVGMTEAAITYLDEYIEMKGYKAKSHYLCIKKWVVSAIKEKQIKTSPKAQELDSFYEMAQSWAESGET